MNALIVKFRIILIMSNHTFIQNYSICDVITITCQILLHISAQLIYNMKCCDHF